ncbi:endoglucanase [Paenibacillus phyllosphaerae]|uniref:Endoglucanase n=1 Tax=Paenibacillus phyllosphaerae TaxID=274593 RepID=A0A7W5AXT5_9BACL|nr:endoglucanase [Paenibacillus phyllosphaerae]
MVDANRIRSITVNQIGYPQEGRKLAVFTAEGSFQVREAASGSLIHLGATQPLAYDEASGQAVAFGDFSAVNQPGRYYIELEASKARSAVFTIAASPYEDVHLGLLKAFYYYRCGTELTEEFAGPWAHGACHLADGTIHGDPSRSQDGCGGWHDAGDYGKYAGPGAKAVADLLLAFECYPGAFRKPVPLPETDGFMPDVLHECRYELNWLFKMQDLVSGGVYHKLTTPHFPPLATRPEDDLSPLVFSPISATATGCFAGVMAMAARVYRPYDEPFALRCLQAAEGAWAWLREHPDVPGFKNPPDISTGEYGDKQDIDERYWAACELYRTTGQSVYHEALQAYSREDFYKYGLGWADMSGYGTIAYLLGGDDQADPALYASLLDGLRQEADLLTVQSEQDGYGLSLLPSQYIWGSNMLVMNHAMLLLFAYRLLADRRYEEAALSHVHYLLGRNAMDTSYVTGFGDQAYRNPHYRPGVADDIEEPVPGFVSGGPNAGLQDECAKAHLTGKPPAQCFIDHEDSYATNEVTIYWNSPALFVVSHWVR